MRLFSRFRSALRFNFILVAVVPLIIISFHIMNIMTRNLNKTITTNHLLITKSLAREVEHFLSDPVCLLGQIKEMTEQKGLISYEPSILLSAFSIMLRFLIFTLSKTKDISGCAIIVPSLSVITT